MEMNLRKTRSEAKVQVRDKENLILPNEEYKIVD